MPCAINAERCQGFHQLWSILHLPSVLNVFKRLMEGSFYWFRESCDPLRVT